MLQYNFWHKLQIKVYMENNNLENHTTACKVY